MVFKHIEMKLMVLFFVLSALAGCGGGGGNGDDSGGPDYVTISVDSGTPYTYTETADSSSPVSYDPYIWSTSTGTTATYMYIHTYENPSLPASRMFISMAGAATGTYNISEGNRIDYMPAGGPNYYCSAWLPETSGTITITEFGAPGGGQIKGSFDVISNVGTSVNAPTAHLEGTFRITRK